LRTLPDDARPIHSLLLVERRFVRSQTDAMLSSAQRTLRAVGVSGSRYARRTVGRHGAIRSTGVDDSLICVSAFLAEVIAQCTSSV
jgi:hypothetical protein